MAEVIGAVSAVSTLIDQSFTILERVQTAIDRQKGHSGYLVALSRDITSTKEIVGLVKDEATLNTPAVLSAIVKVSNVVDKLEKLLQNLEHGGTNSPMRQFAHQFIKGSKEQQRLDELMKALLNVKSDLSLYIQIAHVGLTRTSNEVFVDANIVERIDRLLQIRLGEGKGLQIAELIKQRPRTPNGLVPLTDEDLKILPTYSGQIQAEFRFTPGTSSRIVINNFTHDQAVQVNAPIGTEGFVEVGSLTIRDNVARGYSTQINHGVSREDFRSAINGRFAGLR